MDVGRTHGRLARDMTDNLIEIEGLRYSRGDRLIFDGLDLVVPRGEVTALMGPSGTGKTTLLQIIGGQLTPDAGSVLVNGQDVPMAHHARSRSRR